MIREILGLAIIAVLITSWYEPIQGIKNRILQKINVGWITKIFTCSKCMGLILGTIVTQNIYSGAIISLTGYVINHTIDRIEEWYS
jgi:hypothetical protein